MSKFYVNKQDNESTKELFEKRNYYGSKLSKTGYKNVVDFNFGEKFFYGRVNQRFVPTIMTRDVKRFKKTNAIFVNKEIKVRDFDDFIDKLMPVLQNSTKRNPFTKTGFVKSKNCPIFCSGLAIEIADIDPSVDQEKIDQFVNSKNWDFYLNACASYGFMVDKNIPWRLVADIGNEPTRSPMMDYAEKYGVFNPYDIVTHYYIRVHEQYYSQFKVAMLNLYNRVRLSNFLISEDCEGRVISRVVTPVTYTRDSLFSKYSETDFLKMYFNIRFMEEEINITDNEKNLLIDDCIEIYQNAGLRATLSSFERIINLPFDKRGSLSYIKKQADALQDSKV